MDLHGRAPHHSGPDLRLNTNSSSTSVATQQASTPQQRRNDLHLSTLLSTLSPFYALESARPAGARLSMNEAELRQHLGNLSREAISLVADGSAQNLAEALQKLSQTSFANDPVLKDFLKSREGCLVLEFIASTHSLQNVSDPQATAAALRLARELTQSVRLHQFYDCVGFGLTALLTGSSSALAQSSQAAAQLGAALIDQTQHFLRQLPQYLNPLNVFESSVEDSHNAMAEGIAEALVERGGEAARQGRIFLREELPDRIGERDFEASLRRASILGARNAQEFWSFPLNVGSSLFSTWVISKLSRGSFSPSALLLAAVAGGAQGGFQCAYNFFLQLHSMDSTQLRQEWPELLGQFGIGLSVGIASGLGGYLVEQGLEGLAARQILSSHSLVHRGAAFIFGDVGIEVVSQNILENIFTRAGIIRANPHAQTSETWNWISNATDEIGGDTQNHLAHPLTMRLNRQQQDLREIARDDNAVHQSTSLPVYEITNPANDNAIFDSEAETQALPIAVGDGFTQSPNLYLVTPETPSRQGEDAPVFAIASASPAGTTSAVAKLGAVTEGTVLPDEVTRLYSHQADEGPFLNPSSEEKPVSVEALKEQLRQAEEYSVPEAWGVDENALLEIVREIKGEDKKEPFDVSFKEEICGILFETEIFEEGHEFEKDKTAEAYRILRDGFYSFYIEEYNRARQGVIQFQIRHAQGAAFDRSRLAAKDESALKNLEATASSKYATAQRDLEAKIPLALKLLDHLLGPEPEGLGILRKGALDKMAPFISILADLDEGPQNSYATPSLQEMCEANKEAPGRVFISPGAPFSTLAHELFHALPFEAFEEGFAKQYETLRRKMDIRNPLNLSGQDPIKLALARQKNIMDCFFFEEAWGHAGQVLCELALKKFLGGMKFRAREKMWPKGERPGLVKLYEDAGVEGIYQELKKYSQEYRCLEISQSWKMAAAMAVPDFRNGYLRNLAIASSLGQLGFEVDHHFKQLKMKGGLDLQKLAAQDPAAVIALLGRARQHLSVAFGGGRQTSAEAFWQGTDLVFESLCPPQNSGSPNRIAKDSETSLKAQAILGHFYALVERADPKDVGYFYSLLALGEQLPLEAAQEAFLRANDFVQNLAQGEQYEAAMKLSYQLGLSLYERGFEEEAKPSLERSLAYVLDTDFFITDDLDITLEYSPHLQLRLLAILLRSAVSKKSFFFILKRVLDFTKEHLAFSNADDTLLVVFNLMAELRQSRPSFALEIEEKFKAYWEDIEYRCRGRYWGDFENKQIYFSLPVGRSEAENFYSGECVDPADPVFLFQQTRNPSALEIEAYQKANVSDVEEEEKNKGETKRYHFVSGFASYLRLLSQGSSKFTDPKSSEHSLQSQSTRGWDKDNYSYLSGLLHCPALREASLAFLERLEKAKLRDYERICLAHPIWSSLFSFSDFSLLAQAIMAMEKEFAGKEAKRHYFFHPHYAMAHSYLTLAQQWPERAPEFLKRAEAHLKHEGLVKFAELPEVELCLKLRDQLIRAYLEQGDLKSAERLFKKQQELRSEYEAQVRKMLRQGSEFWQSLDEQHPLRQWLAGAAVEGFVEDAPYRALQRRLFQFCEQGEVPVWGRSLDAQFAFEFETNFRRSQAIAGSAQKTDAAKRKKFFDQMQACLNAVADDLDHRKNQISPQSLLRALQLVIPVKTGNHFHTQDLLQIRSRVIQLLIRYFALQRGKQEAFKARQGKERAEQAIQPVSDYLLGSTNLSEEDPLGLNVARARDAAFETYARGSSLAQELATDEQQYQQLKQFFDLIEDQDTALSAQEKEDTYLEFLERMLPRQAQGWTQLWDLSPKSFHFLLNRFEEWNYPRVEAYLIEKLDSATTGLVLDAKKPAANTSLLMALSALSQVIAKKRPELLHPDHLPACARLSASYVHHQHLLQIFGPQAQRGLKHLGQNNLGGFAYRLGEIYAKDYPASAYGEYISCLSSSFQSNRESIVTASENGPPISRGRRSLAIGEVQEFIQIHQALLRNAVQNLNQAEARAFLDQTLSLLRQALAAKDPNAFTQQWLQTLVQAEEASIAEAFTPLYQEILKWNIPDALEQKAVAGLYFAGRLSNYVYQFYLKNLCQKEQSAREAFMSLISRLSEFAAGEKPDDFFIYFLFQNPQETENFFHSYQAALSHLKDPKTKKWNGDCSDVLDLAIFSFLIFPKLCKKKLKPEQILAQMALRLTQARGAVDISDGIWVLYFDVEARAGTKLHQDFEAAGSVFIQQAQEAREQISQTTLQLPQNFLKLPGLIQFSLLTYLKQLPLGQQEDLVTSLNEEGLSPEQSLVSFLERTGNEKLAQFLSLLDGVLPESYLLALKKFRGQNKAPRKEEVQQLFLQTYGALPEQIFEEFDYDMRRAGSIGKIYKAKLKGGTKVSYLNPQGKMEELTLSEARFVAVKLIPNATLTGANENLKALRAMAEELDENKERFGLPFSPRQLFADFEATYRVELDFRNELQNAEIFAKQLPENMQMPGYYKNLSRAQILILDWVQAAPFDECPSDKIRIQHFDAVAHMLAQHTFGEEELYFEDPQPHNVLIDENGALVLLDFGRLGHLSQASKKNLVQLIVHILSGDVQEVQNILMAMTEAGANSSAALLKAKLDAIFKRSTELNEIFETLDACFKAAFESHFYVRSEFTFLLKAYITLKAIARKDPAIRRFDVQKYLQQAFLEACQRFPSE
ncbi:MAG: AarF/ABC1/UbiB kinase family protein [Deltaproteobacteria bacterium]|nr:AarF/ABC1/UbiB kinase family protein [Deltaproteobacteria bacterium]